MLPITFIYIKPRKFGFRKPFKRKTYNNVKVIRRKAASVNYGYYGLKSMEAARLKYRQIEAVRKAFVFFFKQTTHLIIRLQFNSPVTSKSAGVRMGRGKGKISHWVANVKPGQVIFEVSKQIPAHVLPSVLRVIRERLPIRLRVVKKKIT